MNDERRMTEQEQETLLAHLADRCRVAAEQETPYARELHRAVLQRMEAPETPWRVDGDVPLARRIDHTALKPETTAGDIERLCEEARRYGFATVCVNPCYVALAAEHLGDSPVGVCTVIGFPLGATLPEVKAREVEDVVRNGATEVDMVINVGWLKSGAYEAVEQDIRAVVEAAREARNPRGDARVLTKVILETALLADEEKVIASILAQQAGADFVKTSTGFSKGGATAADVALMRRIVGSGMGVKASGGIRSCADAEAMIAHGATRIGASASVAVVEGQRSDTEY